ncbi:phage tail fiber protein [Dyella silvatica]|uniref:phage tail fiber domain-containing protein n=1 Tax=Dyella silvatica TaxID=2992128 RepID=UPI00225995FD|nr:phage tail fiber protein [Dyella silvatica]
MAQLARGYSFAMYTAEGATYTIPFPYMHAEHIRMFAGDVGDAVEQLFTWLGPTEIKLTGQVPKGILITLRRFTPRDDNLVHIQEGAQLPARDLNLNTTQLLYIIQEQLDFGTYGGHGLPGGGVGWPNPGGSPSLPIQQIIDKIMQSPLMGLLLGRINQIDENAETLLNEILRGDKVYQYRHEDQARVALVETSITQVVTDASALAERVTEVYAKYDKAEGQIRTVDKALSDEKSATATRFEGVNARFGTQEADITNVRQSISDETSARTTEITRARSDFGKDVSAINSTLSTTYATKDFAKSVATQEVQAFAGGNFAHLQQRFEAMASGSSDPDGKWQANYTVRINAGKIDGTPVIAGIGLGVDSKTGSNFVVMADRFAFVSPTYTSTGGVQQMKYPFVIGTVGGVSTVGIQGQLVVDGSITADKIRVNSLSALTANMGEVNGGTFRTFQLDANGSIINPREFRVEMTNNPGDGYPLWIGGGVKNWNNAVFAVDRSGNAKFGGTIEAKNMIGNLQVYGSGEWSGDMAANYGGSTDPFTLPAPTRLGEYHMPAVIAEITCSSTGSGLARAWISLQRLDGSTWVDVRSSQYTLRSAISAVYAFVYFGPPTSRAEQFRFKLMDGGVGGNEFHMYNVRSYTFGLK